MEGPTTYLGICVVPRAKVACVPLEQTQNGQMLAPTYHGTIWKRSGIGQDHTEVVVRPGEGTGSMPRSGRVVGVAQAAV